MKKRVLSGMRPTGKLHLGHLLGALSNWVEFQESHDCFFMVADWHALMSEYANSVNIRENTIDNVLDWLSCGIDPDKSTIFIQSQVKEHSELHLILSVITPLGWLERCPTYKEQIRELKNKDIGTYGFLGYPVLQASDVLLYKADCVPVGKDQLPHLELTREISRRFNKFYGQIFSEPQAILTEIPRLLGTDQRKMSKSYDNYISLSDPPNKIKEKVISMFTDPKRIRLSDPGHPVKCNVYSYYKIFKPELKNKVSDYCKNATVGCIDCKKQLSEILVDFLREIQTRRNKFSRDKGKVIDILESGAKRAENIASKTMEEVRKAIGLISSAPACLPAK